MRVFAHRGYHRQFPENTLEAFQAAVDLGVDGIETDIRASAEGVPILFHDRCLADGTPVSSLTRSELSDRMGYSVPTLEETLSQGWPIEWDLELKDRRSLDAAATLLIAKRAAVRLFVSSFSHPLVLDATARLKVPGGFLIAHAPLSFEHLESATEQVPFLVWDFETVSGEAMKMGAARGFRNMVYGPINREEHVAAAALGLEAIITDEPTYAAT